MNEEVAAVLEQAADLIENVGHCKGSSSTHHGTEITAYCALGALNRAIAQANSRVALYAPARRAMLVEIWGNPLRSSEDIARWNDKPERTAAEVIDTLRRAAKELRNRSGDAGD
jgi:hypothetical protein